MDGTVNLKTEEMDLNIHPHTKGFRVFSLRSPLYVKGTFKDPHVGVSAGALAARSVAAVGLGLLNPFAALIPLIAPSNNKPLPCTQMLADMRTAPSAPPPGQKQKAKGAPGYMEPGVANPAAGSAAAAASSSSGSSNGATKGRNGSSARPAVSTPASAALYRGS
jgi:hypothetical protein